MVKVIYYYLRVGYSFKWLPIQNYRQICQLVLFGHQQKQYLVLFVGMKISDEFTNWKCVR